MYNDDFTNVTTKLWAVWMEMNDAPTSQFHLLSTFNSYSVDHCFLTLLKHSNTCKLTQIRYHATLNTQLTPIEQLSIAYEFRTIDITEDSMYRTKAIWIRFYWCKGVTGQIRLCSCPMWRNHLTVYFPGHNRSSDTSRSTHIEVLTSFYCYVCVRIINGYFVWFYISFFCYDC